MGRPLKFLLTAILVATMAHTAAPMLLAADGPVTPADIQKLGKILKEGTGYKARAQAARALGLLRSTEAVAPLLRGLEQDPDQLVRAACAWALGSINHPGALDALVKASKKDVGMVKTQAGRAIEYIIAAFPGNAASARLHVAVEGLKDQATRNTELTNWLQHYFVEHLVKCPSVDLGEEMDIEEEGATPEHAEDACPPVRVALVGGLDRVDVPKGRTAGDVVVNLKYTLVLLALDKTTFTSKGHKGVQSFVGGAAPTDPWADDPLLEVQKGAIGQAVALGFADLASYLGLKPTG